MQKDKLINYYTKTPYIGMDEKPKVSIKTERVYHKEKLGDILAKLNGRKKQYCSHRFHEANEKFEWPKITSTINQYGTIYWIDYSENIPACIPKDEPQAAHFCKTQISLHCTVGLKMNDIQPEYSYFYHFSNNNTHDSVYTNAVIDDIVKNEKEIPEIYRFKSDNCRAQFKCKYVFPNYRNLAKV